MQKRELPLLQLLSEKHDLVLTAAIVLQVREESLAELPPI
jgi:hypothetical protein